MILNANQFNIIFFSPMSEKAKKIIGKIVTGLAIFFFALTVIIIFLGVRSLASNKPMMFFGYTYSVVPTESMEPDIHAGDFVISKRVPFEELQVGDDIIYYSESEDIYIIHRIINIEDGLIYTKGINNPVADKDPVTKDNYISKAIWNGSLAGVGNVVAKNRMYIFILMIIILAFVFLSEVYKIMKKKNEDKEAKQEAEKEALQKAHEEALRELVLEELKLESMKEEEKKE